MARLRYILTSAFCLSTGATALTAHAQEALPAAVTSDGYPGVCPGSANPPAVNVPAGQAPATITWPGFQMLPDGSSRIFLQASVPFTFSTETRGKTFVVSLGDVAVAGENNRHPLETRFFNTPVLRAALKRAKKETQLIVELRADVAPRVQSATGANGYFFLQLDFPAGQYIESPTPAVAVVSPTTAPAAAAAPAADPLTGGSIGVRASGTVRTSGMTDAEARALENERPPGVRASGSLNLGGSTRQ